MFNYRFFRILPTTFLKLSSNLNLLDSGSGAIANFAMKALTSFQSFMKEGNNELGIPRLDPVHMDNFNYSLDNNPVGFRMEIVFEVGHKIFEIYLLTFYQISN